MNAGAAFKIFADCRCEIAETPRWLSALQMLYWRGSEGEVYRKALVGGPKDFDCFRLQVGMIGGMVFTRKNVLLLFAEHGRVWRWLPGSDPVLVAELPEATGGTCFNDVIADPQGRIFCGVLANGYFNPAKRAKHGSLWRLDSDGTFHCLEPATGTTPNGMGFSPDQEYFYFVVSDEKTVYRYDYDSRTGNIANRKALVFINCGGPDGMTVDAEGCLWVAQWGGPLARYSPAGKKLLEYQLPVRAISSVAFGGQNYTVIFVTTADYPRPKSGAPGCMDGGVFKLEQSIRGVSEFSAEDILR